MKILLLLPLTAMVLFSNSCRTACPLDPETMRPDCSRCHIAASASSCHHPGYRTTTEESTVSYSK